MKKLKDVLLCTVLSLLIISVTACNNKKEVPNTIENGGFETGTLAGWTTEGNAFGRSGVVSDEIVEGYSVGKTGTNFFNGLEAGPQSFTGSMKSETFKIDGKGYIAFLLGAGKDNSKCYVAVYDAVTNEELERQENTDFDGTFVTTQLIRYVVDVSKHIGKTAYIKVVDEDSDNNFSYVIVDDFIPYIKDDEQLNKYIEERAKKLASLVPPPFEEDETLSDIQNPGFEEADLSGWKILSGTAFNSSATADSKDLFWDTREFNAIGGMFLNGYNNGESAVGELRSSKFTLAGDGFISFLIGGAGSESCYVSINDGNTDVELIKISNDSFKDPEMALNMSRVYVDVSEYLGKILYIKITDKASDGPFGAITVDDFHVSMTKDDVQALMLETYQWAMGLGDDTISDYIRNYYMTYTYPFELPILRITKSAVGQAIYTNSSVDVNNFITDVKGECGTDTNVTVGIESITCESTTISDVFDQVDMSLAGNYTVNYSVEYNGEKVYDTFIINVSNENDILNADFESNNLAGWTVLTMDTLNADSAISKDFTFWGEEIPYNNYGTYHFNGWSAQYNEEDAYTIRSSIFKLGGSGYISFRMGGNAAAVKVFQVDGTLIGTYLNTAFADVNFPNLDEGCRLATMTTFVADLSAYIGEELFVELYDLGVGPWGLAFFDHIVVNYEEAPDVSNMSDSVIFNKKVDDTLTPTEYEIPWVLAVSN